MPNPIEGLPPILMPARNYIAASLQTSEGVRETKIWGGFITENACQAIARDIFGEILLRLEKAGISVVLHSHDEVLVEVPLEVSKEEIERLMTLSPKWAKGLPLGAEAKELFAYAK